MLFDIRMATEIPLGIAPRTGWPWTTPLNNKASWVPRKRQRQFSGPEHGTLSARHQTVHCFLMVNLTKTFSSFPLAWWWMRSSQNGYRKKKKQQPWASLWRGVMKRAKRRHHWYEGTRVGSIPLAENPMRVAWSEAAMEDASLYHFLWPRNRQEEKSWWWVNGTRETESKCSCTAYEGELGKVVSRFCLPDFHSVSI